MRLTPEGSLVETTTVAPSDTCSMVHDATGRGTAGDTTAATLRARADIRNRAARMGGNVVLLETQTTRVLPSGTLEVVIFGKVYKCRK